MTGPGEAERDKNETESLAPSAMTGMAGDAGLLVVDDWLLPELLCM